MSAGSVSGASAASLAAAELPVHSLLARASATNERLRAKFMFKRPSAVQATRPAASGVSMTAADHADGNLQPSDDAAVPARAARSLPPSPLASGPSPSLCLISHHDRIMSESLLASPAVSAPVLEDLRLNHIADIHRAIFDAQHSRERSNARKLHFFVPLRVDAALLLDACPAIGVLLLGDIGHSVQHLFALACFRLLQEQLSGQRLFPESVRTRVRLARLPPLGLPEKTLGMHDWMALGSQAIMVRGCITRLALPTYTAVARLFVCENAGCRDRNEMHVSTLPDGHVLVKRSSTGKCLGVSNRKSIKPVDLVCAHCGSTLVESAPDVVHSLRQQGQLTTPLRRGCFSKCRYLEVASRIGHPLLTISRAVISFVLDDELVNSAQVGDLAMLVGVPDGKYAFGKTWESSTAQMSIKLNNMARLRWATVIQTFDHPHGILTPETVEHNALERPFFEPFARVYRTPFEFSSSLVDLVGGTKMPCMFFERN
ncbi:hypothetical protein HK105_203719 [Polyrhizophydium stewartii]|uniref:Uncharacterized protein n=1 Tax=Polyrhizophydium stewartii TaxID=2732419 RepID=A0ABR4NAS8_9FUNG